MLLAIYYWGDKNKRDAMVRECARQGGNNNAYRASFFVYVRNITSEDHSQDVGTNRRGNIKVDRNEIG